MALLSLVSLQTLARARYDWQKEGRLNEEHVTVQ